MYTDFYKLKEFPFNLTPDPKFLYFSAGHQEALAQMTYGIKMKRGFMSLTGEVGTGKTTLIYTLLSKLDANTQKAFIFHSILGAKGLFRSICREFGIAVNSDETKTDMTIKLHNFLITNFRSGGNAVLIIDESQNLTPHVLEEVRLLSNLETPRTKLLQILLVGQPELRTILDRPDMRQLKQRIAFRFHLSRLSRQETEQYINHRLRVAQHKPATDHSSDESLSRDKMKADKIAAPPIAMTDPSNGDLNWEQLRDRQFTRHQSAANPSMPGNITSAGLIDEELGPHRNSNSIFTPDAIGEIYRYTTGIPRAINVLCDKALLLGYTLDAHRISAKLVKKIELDDLASEIESFPTAKHSEAEPKRYLPVEQSFEKRNPAPFTVSVGATLPKKSHDDNSRLTKLRKRFPNLFSLAS